MTKCTRGRCAIERASLPSRLSAALGATLGAVLAVGVAAAQTPPAAVASAPHAESRLRVTQIWIRWLPANLPAGGYLTLMTQARAAVRPGQSLPLTLRFADGGTLTVNAAVRYPADAAPGKPAGKGMSGMPGMSDMPNMPGISY